MPGRESFELYIRLLREKFETFKNKLESFLEILPQNAQQSKVDSARDLLDSLRDLKASLSSGDQPAWMNPVEKRLNWYIGSAPTRSDAGYHLLKDLFNYYNPIRSQSWDTESGLHEGAIDFFAIYQAAYNESRVPELFEELISQLEKLVESEEIDSRQAIRALERLIATIRKNRLGDYLSTRATWDFVRAFFRNYALEILESIPALGPAVKAIRKTLNDLNQEFNEVHSTMATQLSDSFGQDLPILEYKPLALPGPKRRVGKGRQIAQVEADQGEE